MRLGIREAQPEFEFVKGGIGKKAAVAKPRPQGEPSLVFTWRVPYDRLILSGIGMLLVIVLFFSLGVERGKIVAGQRPVPGPAPVVVPPKAMPPSKQPVRVVQSPPRTIPPPKEQPAPVMTSRPPVVKAEAKTDPKPAPVDMKYYTIQAVTILSKEQAEREVAKLKTKGFEPFVMKSGKYIVVCVGKNSSEQNAKGSERFKKLRRLYHDCFVRRMT